MPDDLDLLTDRQAGHLRHFGNLARQLPNDWSLMQGRGFGQDDFGGYRFQLAYMAYALALTHRHRLPAAPGAFRPTFERLIAKMLLPEVWMYWARVSRGGSVFNAHLVDRLTEQWDPVGRDNIMYSAYLQSMALLYAYLFDDQRYAAPGALTLSYWSFFWGGAERRFEYDQNSLNETIYWQMVESGYLGVACEPNCVFQICNQPAILGFRMHDLLTGSDRANEVTTSYERTWRELGGRLGANGHFNLMAAADTRAVRANEGRAPWGDAWCGLMMNMWHRDFVRAHYPAVRDGWLLHGRDGALSVRSAERQLVMGQKIVNDDSDFGWAAAWASEMGDAETLRGFQRHAERHMRPRWRQGGYHYPRHDEPVDAEGNRTLVEAMTGNVLLGFADLNVSDGLHTLYQTPWSSDHHSEPALTRVDDGLDVLQARFNPSARRLVFALRRAKDTEAGASVVISHLPEGLTWSLSADNQVIAIGRGSELESSATDVLHATPLGLQLSCESGELTRYSVQIAAEK